MDEWTVCAGNWRQSTLFQKLTTRKKTKSFGTRIWMTRHQLCQKFGSAELADRIIEAKMLLDEESRASQVRDHPDAPGVEEPCHLSHTCTSCGHVVAYPIVHLYQFDKVMCKLEIRWL